MRPDERPRLGNGAGVEAAVRRGDSQYGADGKSTGLDRESVKGVRERRGQRMMDLGREC